MKYLVVIGDGMADFALPELGGKTPLQAARKPHIDRISREGFCGQVITVPPGYLPGSDVACMSLFGYDPGKVLYGPRPHRGIRHGDRARRGGRRVPVQPRLPRRAGAEGLYGRLQRRTDHDATRRGSWSRISATRSGARNSASYPGVGYRHLMVWKGGSAEMVTTPPHDILDKEVIDHMPAGDGSQAHHQAHERLADIPERPSGQQGPDRPGRVSGKQHLALGPGQKASLSRLPREIRGRRGGGGRGRSGKGHRGAGGLRDASRSGGDGVSGYGLRSARPEAAWSCSTGTISSTSTWRRLTRRPTRGASPRR